MTRIYLVIAAFCMISTLAEAADGCGRGWFYNGRRCVPQDEAGPRFYRERPRDYEPERERRYEERERRYEGREGPPPRYEPEPQSRYYEPQAPADSPQLRFDLGGREETRYSPPNPAFKTWNNCPPNFTVQDGLCKPYTGR